MTYSLVVNSAKARAVFSQTIYSVGVVIKSRNYGFDKAIVTRFYSNTDDRKMSMYHVGEGDLHLSEEEIEDFREAFGLFDREGKGSITIDDLKSVLRSLGKNPTDDELQDMIREVDDDESGTIEFPEFLTMMVRKVKAPDSVQELIDAFRVFDTEGNGFISAHYLRHVLTTLGEKLNQVDIEELVKHGDIHKDGEINYVEFVRLMSK